MKLKYVVFYAFILTGLIFNLQMPKKIVDQIQMITVTGFDATEQDKLRGTAVTPKYLEKGQIKDNIYTDTADTVYEDWVKLNAKATERILNGKLQIALYDKDLAKRGIKDLVEFLTRDPSIGGNVRLVIAEESTRDVINAVKTSKGRGVFFDDLFEHNIRHGNLPQTNLKLFNSSLLSDKFDPFLPMFGTENNKAVLTGIAFFDDDQYVDEIPIEDANVFKLLYEDVSDGAYQYKSEAYNVSVENLESDKRVVFDAKGESGELTIHVSIRGTIREIISNKPVSKMNEIENDIGKRITQQAEQLINRFQELKIDPLGLEMDVKGASRQYKQSRFQSAYPDMPINVKADVTITETGTRR